MMTQSAAEPAHYSSAQMGVGWICIRQWALLCMCHCVFCLLACLTSDSTSLRHRAASQNVTAVSCEAAVWLVSINYDPSLSPTLEFNLQGDNVVLVALIKEKALCRAAWLQDSIKKKKPFRLLSCTVFINIQLLKILTLHFICLWTIDD